MTSGRRGLISEPTEQIMFVEGASAIHAKVLEAAPLLLCFSKFSISTQDVTKVFSRGAGIFGGPGGRGCFLLTS